MKPWLGDRWWRWLQAIAGLAIIAFVVRYLVRNWTAIRTEPVQWDINVGWLALYLLVVLATFALLAESWRRMLAGWGARLAFVEAARVWVLSSMGKYLPGKVWSLAGMAMLAERRGISPVTATASALLLQVVSLGTGALLVGATGVATLESHRPGAKVALVVIVLGSIAALVVALSPPFARRLRNALGRMRRTGAPRGAGEGEQGGMNDAEPAQRVTPSIGAVGFGVAANLVAWGAYGFALWCLAQGLLPAANLAFRDAIGGFAGSYIAGLLFLLAPGGLGVREGVLLWMLQDRIGPANALALAGVSRIGMTVADLLAALPFVLWLRRRNGE